MEPWQALVLGVIQGVSELFPVSSLAQVILIPALLRWPIDREGQDFLAFVVALHLATAIALVIYFWRDWLLVIRAYIGSVQRMKLVYDDASKFAWLLVAGTIIVGFLGLVFEKKLRALFDNSANAWIVAVILILNGGVMLLGDFMKRRSESPSFEPEASDPGAPESDPVIVSAKVRKTAEQLSFVEGTLVGGAQTLALLPGISRSGVTIVGGLLAGLSYEQASRFSFMLATPIIGLAALKEVPKLLKTHGILGYTIPSAPLAGVTAYFSVRFLMNYFKHNRLAPFGYYCVAFGILALVVLRMRTGASAPSAAAQPVIREGTFIVDRTGQLTMSSDGLHDEFIFDADGSLIQDPPMNVLQNCKLELMEHAVAGSKQALEFHVTGLVTEYRNRNCLLMERVVVVPMADSVPTRPGSV